jgi:aspartate-semialdehyde dehydrogenase
MIIPDINPQHADVIPYQRKRLGTDTGFIAVKSNCSLQSYVPAIHPLLDLGVEKVLTCTYQAISGAGKTFDSWPEMLDNVIPFIRGEEEKSEHEPEKIWGEIQNGVIIPSKAVPVTSQCIRVPVSDGHLAAVFVSLRKFPGLDEIKSRWANFEGEPQKLKLPSAPQRFIHYFEQEDRPQTRLDRDLENGMAVSVGRLRRDSQYTIKFICLSHNTIRGAAGGGVLMAELLCAKGYINKQR